MLSLTLLTTSLLVLQPNSDLSSGAGVSRTSVGDTEVRFSSFGYVEGDSDAMPIQWAETITADDIVRNQSADANSAFGARFSCRFQRSGRLTGCTILEEQLVTQDMRRHVQAIPRSFRLSRDFVDDHDARMTTVYLSVEVHSAIGQRTATTPCIMPICSIVIGPPPPPR